MNYILRGSKKKSIIFQLFTALGMISVVFLVKFLQFPYSFGLRQVQYPENEFIHYTECLERKDNRGDR